MSAPRSDLDFVADILSGQSSSQAARNQNRNRRNSQQHRQPTAQQPTNQPNQPSTNTQYNTPGPNSTPRALHCEACDCWVPNKPGTWKVHTDGIRHQRQLLSLRIHGERGHLVLSAFESAPGPSGSATHRLVGNAASDFGLQQTNPGAALERDEQAMLQAIEVKVRAAVVSLWGSANPVFNRVMRNFETSFPNALMQAQRTLEGRRRRRSGQQPALAVSSLGEYPLDVATLAHLLPHSSIEDICHLDIDMYPYDVSRISQVQAWMTSVYMLLSTIASAPSSTSITKLTIREGGLRSEFLPTEARWDAAYRQGWRKALGLIRDIIENPRHYSIRQINLHLQEQQEEVTVDPELLELVTTAGTDLQQLARSTVDMLRTQVLLGYHSRAGRCSILQLLPIPVMKHILDGALPLDRCEVRLDIQIHPNDEVEDNDNNNEDSDSSSEDEMDE